MDLMLLWLCVTWPHGGMMRGVCYRFHHNQRALRVLYKSSFDIGLREITDTTSETVGDTMAQAYNS